MNKQLSTWLGVFVALGLAAAAYGQSFSDDFSSGNDNAYTHYDPLGKLFAQPWGTWTVSGGTYTLWAKPSTLPSMIGPARLGSLVTGLDVADFTAGIDLLSWSSTKNSPVAGLVARLGNIGLGSTTGYAMLYDAAGQEVDIVRLTGEGSERTVASQSITFDPTHDYRLELTAVGQNFFGRVYDLANPGTPLAQLSGTDTAYASGLVGPFIFDNSATGDGDVTATFDNLQVQVVPEPCALALMAGFGLMGFALARRYANKRS